MDRKQRPAAVSKKNKRTFFQEMRKNWAYYTMMLPAGLVVFLFAYLPMPGLIIAFQDFNFVDRFKSPFVGLNNFKFFFTSSYAVQTTVNTLVINFNYLIWTTFLAVAVAIILNEIKGRVSKKIYQNAIFIPYFISSVVVGRLVRTMLFADAQGGVINQLLGLFGAEPVKWSTVPVAWPFIIVGAHLWQLTGYTSIVYLASIAGFDREMYEAASLDGASRWQKIRYITVPLLMPSIIVMMLLSIGGMLRGDFANIYAIIEDNGMLFKYTDVIDTYVFRAIKGAAEFGTTTAIGLYQSVVGFILVMGSNWLAKKYDKDSGLF
ncbi:MAG: sugar ABC transporter permease [Lachnospiraceae bacterium]|nr:sugar ABC transporter permease [Lachnospiraceae bacterium]